ncbi:MAG: tRNA (N(6)-L-threonylcarbamoyladenosine(37)-C(2))-methylthiotransferase MtaB [Peptococcaceae bacterium]|nr:MAG: tRNA (N(6)-L-threonylcarbamoyladenosine(37)-C(2))-methylthiotransferase MtaB [Peptococcaceae bacterium]
MKQKKVAVCTLGCKVNQYESAALAGLFRDRGYEVVDCGCRADVYVINTCTVTHLGDRKSRQLIRRAAGHNPEAVVVVTGCYAQASPEEVSGIPGVDLVVGTHNRVGLVDMVESAVRKKGPFNKVRDFGTEEDFEELLALPYQSRTRALLKIQDGCESFCAYCIVPYVRGPLRSRQPEKVLDEARRLVDEGYKEIVLTGVHTGAYGQDLQGNIDLSDLIRKLASIPGLLRLRLSSVEPNDITPRLLEVLAGTPVFCRHLHLPLQSGDDEILARMGRRYSAREYARLLEAIRVNMPGVAITTDIMVGFPGETDKHFNNSYQFVKEMALAGIHVFKYSSRRGTPAASFTGQVEPIVKEQRSRLMISLAEEMAVKFAAAMLGQVVTVLVEKPCGEEKGFYEGLTGNYVRVVFPARKDLRGEMVTVRLEKQKGTILEGIIDNGRIF